MLIPSRERIYLLAVLLDCELSANHSDAHRLDKKMTLYARNRGVKHIPAFSVNVRSGPMFAYGSCLYGCNGTGYLGVVQLEAAVVTTKREYKSLFMMRRLELIIDFMSHHRVTVALEVLLYKTH